MQRRRVLLPDPLEPIIEITLPVCAESDTPFNTSMLPKRLCRSMTSSAASGAFVSFTQAFLLSSLGGGHWAVTPRTRNRHRGRSALLTRRRREVQCRDTLWVNPHAGWGVGTEQLPEALSLTTYGTCGSGAACPGPPHKPSATRLETVAPAEGLISLLRGYRYVRHTGNHSSDDRSVGQDGSQAIGTRRRRHRHTFRSAAPAGRRRPPGRRGMPRGPSTTRCGDTFSDGFSRR